MFRPNMEIKTTLPQIVESEPYIPTEEEVGMVAEYIYEHYPIYYDMFILACRGMRRSEICAVVAEQVLQDKNGEYYLKIDRAKVMNKNKKWVIKTAKTPKSVRTIKIPKETALSILEKGYAFNGYPNDNYKILRKSCTKLGIPVFSIHKCRHYFASALISENVDLASVAYNGGWKSFSMLEKRYGHAFKKRADAAMDVINKTVPVHGKSTDSNKGA